MLSIYKLLPIRTTMSRPRSTILWILVSIGVMVFLTFTLSSSFRPSLRSNQPEFRESGWEFNFDRDANSHSLSKANCDASFPGLFGPIDNVVSSRTQNRDWVRLKDLDIPPGRCMLRVLIYEGELRIVDLGSPLECYVMNGRERIIATLSLIQRALTSAPQGETIPNIEFPISYDDMPTRSTEGVTWGLTRKQDEPNVWLMPDYGYWSWWDKGLPSFKTVWRQMRELDSNYTSWEKKIPKAIWRGLVEINPGIRDKLVETAKDTVWGDVKNVAHGEDDENFLTLDKHCKYQYILYAEGTSYSGRMKFLQLCRSITVSHKMEWSEFTTHLLRSAGPKQNFVEVSRDWSDLEQKINYYRDHPIEAEAIVEESYQTFNRRYLTPAAVSCYLREMFHGWAKVQGFDPALVERTEDGDYRLRGLPFEALVVSFPQDRPGEYGKFAPS